MKKLEVLVITLAVVILLGSGYLVYNKLKPVFTDVELQEIINMCSNRSLIDSAYCVRDLTKPFFKYNISNEGKDLEFETLKREGGMCGAWADYWCEVGDKLGYYTERVVIDSGVVNFTYKGVYKEWLTTHAFCIWSDSSSFVIADGITITKFKFGVLPNE